MCGVIKLFNFILLMLHFFYNYCKSVIHSSYNNTLRVSTYMNHWAKWYLFTKFKNIISFNISLLFLRFFSVALVCVIIYYELVIAEYSFWYVAKHYYAATLGNLNYATFLLNCFRYYDWYLVVVTIKIVKLTFYLNNFINLYGPVFNSLLWDAYFDLLNVFFYVKTIIKFYGPFFNSFLGAVYLDLVNLLFYFKIIVNFCYTVLYLLFTFMVYLKNIIILYSWIFILFLTCKNLYVNYHKKSLQVYLLSMDFHKTLLLLWVVW